MLCVLGDINENGLVRSARMGNLDMSDQYLYDIALEIKMAKHINPIVTCATLNYKIYASKQCKCTLTSEIT